MLLRIFCPLSVPACSNRHCCCLFSLFVVSLQGPRRSERSRKATSCTDPRPQGDLLDDARATTLRGEVLRRAVPLCEKCQRERELCGELTSSHPSQTSRQGPCHLRQTVARSRAMPLRALPPLRCREACTTCIKATCEVWVSVFCCEHEVPEGWTTKNGPRGEGLVPHRCLVRLLTPRLANLSPPHCCRRSLSMSPCRHDRNHHSASVDEWSDWIVYMMAKCCRSLACKAFTTDGRLKHGVQPDHRMMDTTAFMTGSIGDTLVAAPPVVVASPLRYGRGSAS